MSNARTISSAATGLLAFLALFLFSGSLLAGGAPIEQAIKQSRRTGRPVMVVATRATCLPCQSMKLRLRQDPTLEEFRRNFIIVATDLADDDFQWVAQKYPVPVEMVPMVYVIAPSGDLLYANAGALEVSQLVALHDSTLQIIGTPLSEPEIVQNERRLQLVREAAINSQLTKALRLVSPVSSQHSSASSVVTANGYEKRIVRAISEWGADLSGRLANGKRIHESACVLASLYVKIPKKYGKLRAEIIAELRHHEARPSTRTAIKQAKQLVRARVEEGRNLNSEAFHSLQQVIALDPDSPSGRYAARRAIQIRQRMDSQVDAAARPVRPNARSAGFSPYGYPHFMPLALCQR